MEPKRERVFQIKILMKGVWYHSFAIACYEDYDIKQGKKSSKIKGFWRFKTTFFKLFSTLAAVQSQARTSASQTVAM